MSDQNTSASACDVGAKIQLLLPSPRRKPITFGHQKKPFVLSVCVRNTKTIFLMFSTNENLSGRLTFHARCSKKNIFLPQHIAKTGGSRCYQDSVSVYNNNNNKPGRVHFHSVFREVVFLCSQIPIILNILILEEPQKTHP